MLPPHLAATAAGRVLAQRSSMRRIRSASHRARRAAAAGSISRYGDAFPHEADMDQLAGVDFAKGLLRRPGGGVAHGAPRHRPHPRRAGALRRRGAATRRRRSSPASASSATWAPPPPVGRSPCCGSTASPTRSRTASRSPPAATSVRLVKPDWARFSFPGESKAAE